MKSRKRKSVAVFMGVGMLFLTLIPAFAQDQVMSPAGAPAEKKPPRIWSYPQLPSTFRGKKGGRVKPAIGVNPIGGEVANPTEFSLSVFNSRSMALEKLAPELRMLFTRYSAAWSISHDTKEQVISYDIRGFYRDQLKDLCYVRDDTGKPAVGVAIVVDDGSDISQLTAEGAAIYFRSGSTVYAEVPVSALARLARQRNVVSISSVKSTSSPVTPKSVGPPIVQTPPVVEGGGNSTQLTKPDNEFEKQGLTGKGVIIGVVDTGIDWTHKDFIRPDGTSRILYIWDQTDQSFALSRGKIGSAAPTLAGSTVPGLGTLYTNEQINAALKGEGTLNSMDNNGHGTATASTAAGNGLATAKGVPAGTYAGVAPEADLIIVKAGVCGAFEWHYILGTIWIAEKAKQLRRPAVINHSLGGHYTAHDGSEREEQTMNELVGKGKQGLAITVSAGNEGQLSLHATGRFGPKRPSQHDFVGDPVGVYVSSHPTKQGLVVGYFDHEDDWGLILESHGSFLVDDEGKPILCQIYKDGDKIRVQLPDGATKPAGFDEFEDQIKSNGYLTSPGGKVDQLLLFLPPGGYWIVGFANSSKVRKGSFDLYAPDITSALTLFTYGAEKKGMVGSAGNASDVITVGGYDFRSNWLNQHDQETLYHLNKTYISKYSSPGGPRDDGVYKPDIAAPASYTISALSRAAMPDGICKEKSLAAKGGPTSITQDGFHIAWEGTSAAAPFTAGVIALMFQKNPQLDSNQIKRILRRTAIRNDRYVGATPNPEWGYGKINPAAAIAAVPALVMKPAPLLRKPVD